ncbi:MAG: endonuclease [Candidatus Marinimicrobia bacterium]|nr:endonuclease [Candidatus Neomarinimicrobiota bacterium]MCF7828548.1 endonuclease [Candidatus Neomarinimicrobiota bacterium]MCF7882029.1 endonuclease [Candidatus Neomarinimicrobiota bacterium]
MSGYKNFVGIFLSFFLLQSLFAQPPNTTIAPELSSDELLQYVINHYTPTEYLGYDRGRDTLYSKIDILSGDSLRGVYSGFTMYIDPSMDPSKAAYDNGNGISAEHTWPQSMGAGDVPQRGDLHNLFPTKQSVNERRGNKPFAEIPDSETDVWYYKDSQTGVEPSVNHAAYSEVDYDKILMDSTYGVFEPREDHKGNAARAVFYFYAIYNSVAKDSFFTVQKETLFDWNYEDPVDQREYDRTHAIAQYQDDKPNPFVLDSTLARRIWFTTVTPEADTLIFADSFEDGTDSWHIYRAGGSYQWERNSDTAVDGVYSMYMNGYGDDGQSDDWLISPSFSLTDIAAPILRYDHYYDNAGPDLKILVSTEFDGTQFPDEIAWTVLNDNSPAESRRWEEQEIDLSDYVGEDQVTLAFHYTSTGTGDGEAALWRIDDVRITASYPRAPIPPLLITEVADPSDNSDAKFVELYNASENLIDFDTGSWKMYRQAGGNTFGTIYLSETVDPGGYYLIANDINGFENAYEISPDVGSIAVSGNGDDGYFLYYYFDQSDSVLVDAYGVIDEDGTGAPWDYTDGHASRVDSVDEPSASWIAEEWIIEKPATVADMTPGSPTTTTDHEIAGLPNRFTVSPAYPNPFNPATTVEFVLPERTTVHIGVYNLRGQNVYSQNLGRRPVGRHSANLHLANQPSGLYLIRISTPREYRMQKVMLLK